MNIPLLRVAVSVDGLPEHHDVRRKPATYERILASISDCTVNIHWVVTSPMLRRQGYLEEYVSFWSVRREVNRIWVSTYSPQIGEQSAEMLTQGDKQELLSQFSFLSRKYPKFLASQGIIGAFRQPPSSPQACLFSSMSTNYSADLMTRVEPCVLGGSPDCSQCGCIVSIGLHSVNSVRVAGPLNVDHLIRASMFVGKCAASLRHGTRIPERWRSHSEPPRRRSELVQIKAFKY